jgi:hypothetical protein
MSELGVITAYAEAVIAGFAKVGLQNFFVGTACNIKRCLRIVQRPKNGPNPAPLILQKTAFSGSEPLLRHSGQSSNSFSCSIQEPPFSLQLDGDYWITRFFSRIEH